jgi:hypothetical protein
MLYALFTFPQIHLPLCGNLAARSVTAISTTHPVGELELVEVMALFGVDRHAGQTLRALRHPLEEGGELERLGHQRAAHGPVVRLRLAPLLTRLPHVAMLKQ